MPHAAADYRDDIGYNHLQDALGASLPDGRGVRLAVVEAATGPGLLTFASAGTWWPETEHGEFRGKRFHFQSPAGDGSHSGHASNVGRLFFGRTTSMTPAATEIDLYSATDWTSAVLRTHSPFFPAQMDARVINHSWVGSTGSVSYDGEILRRLDWSVTADRNVHVVGIGHGKKAPALIANAFNVIPVGGSGGNGGASTSSLDRVYREGRTMPLIVAPMDTVSAATPVVASAAAMLVQSAQRRRAFSRGQVRTLDGRVIRDGERPEVIKAILMAGASRRFAAAQGSYRELLEDRTANGLDRRYGAGEVNVLNSYAILSGGEQRSAEDAGKGRGRIRAFGYDLDDEFGGGYGSNSVANYYFTAGTRQRWLTATLSWHLRIAAGTELKHERDVVLHDLDLELYDDTEAQRIAVSASWSENTETLWFPLTRGHRYRMVVKAADDEPPFSWRYALAWRIDGGEMVRGDPR